MDPDRRAIVLTPVFRPKVPTRSQMGSRLGAQARDSDGPIGWCNRRARIEIGTAFRLQLERRFRAVTER